MTEPQQVLAYTYCLCPTTAHSATACRKTVQHIASTANASESKRGQISKSIRQSFNSKKRARNGESGRWEWDAMLHHCNSRYPAAEGW